MPFAIWIDLELIKLRERQIAYDITYRRNLEMGTCERIYRAEALRLRKQTQELPKEKERPGRCEGRGRDNADMGINHMLVNTQIDREHSEPGVRDGARNSTNTVVSSWEENPKKNRCLCVEN